MTKHFNPIVAKSIRNKMLETAKIIENEYIDNQTYNGALSSCNGVEPISGVELSGYIPFQDGGYALSSLYKNEINEPTFSKLQADHVVKEYDDMIKDLRECYNLSLSEDVPDNLSEELQEYESEFYSQAYTEIEFKIYCKCKDGNDSRFSDDKDYGVFVELWATYNHAPEILFKNHYTFKEFDVIVASDVLKSLPTF